MIQLFTALLVFSHFITGLPNPDDFQKLPKSQLVQMYSSACLNFYKRPEFEGANLPGLIQNLLASSPEQGKMGWMEGKGRAQDVIQFYNKICKSNPDLTALDPWDSEIKSALLEYKDLGDSLPDVIDVRKATIPQSTEVISFDNKIIGDIYIKEGRRKSISIDQLPPYIPATFVAVEDARFFDHKGVDEIGIMRAMLKDVTSTGARQGASTISQQVARNLYLSNIPTMRRKMQEILIAEKMERQLSKKEILEIYLNLIYFGRNSWGIEKAAQSYFGKSAKNLTPLEGAFLVGIVHGPNLYRNRPQRIEKRVQFVIERMKDKSVQPLPSDKNIMGQLKIISELDIYNAGYFRDYASEQARRINPPWIASGHQIRTTLDSRMQLIANDALQEGLLNYEKNWAHREWEGPLDNIGDAISANIEKAAEAAEMNKVEQAKGKESLFSSLVAKPKLETAVVEKPWVAPLSARSARFIPPVARWKLATYLDDGKIGISDGTEAKISPQSMKWVEQLEMGDIFYVQPAGRGIWEIVQLPEINGAVVVMTTTGRVLALVGGFNYSMSGYNRATQALRQPGSLMKPFTYLTALQKGIQPNTLLSDESLTFPPSSPGGKPWRPVNYGREINGPARPMRWALENSRNVMTAYLMSQIGLNPIREMAESFGMYETAAKEYPFILGAQETTLLNVVKTYGEFANGGYTVSPLAVDRVTDPSGATTEIKPYAQTRIFGADDISLFQLRYLLQGVVARGTAARLAKYSNIIAGKTGTSNESKDIWFMGFTSKIVVGVYIGYDNPETLGDRTTGGGVALPIFEKILASGIQPLYFPEPFPSAPPGVIFLPTNKLTGEIVSAPTPETVLEAYRDGAIKKEQK